jgi:hypothetical protein
MLTLAAQAGQVSKEQQPQKKSRKPKPPVGVLPAILKTAVDYLTLTGVNWTSPWLETKVQSPQLLRALHVATWIIASVPFINFCHSCWMTVGEVGQWLAPSAAYKSWEFNPSPWGPVGAVIEYGLAGEYSHVSVKISLMVDRPVGRDLAQLLQIWIPVGLRPGPSTLNKSEVQGPSAGRASVLELLAFWVYPFLRFMHAPRQDPATQRIAVLHTARRCGGVPGLRFRSRRQSTISPYFEPYPGSRMALRHGSADK